MNRLKSELPEDWHGNRIQDIATKRYEVSGNVTDQDIFADLGIIVCITIWKDVDGGTVQLKDALGGNITPQAKTDYGGSFVMKYVAHNGCKVTTTGFAGGELTVFYMD